MNNMSCKRKKKWLGAVIGGVTSIASSLINAKMQANAIKEQQNQQNKQLAMQHAANLTAQYNNTDYVDSMHDKIVYRAGGKTAKTNGIAKTQTKLITARMGTKYKRKCSK